MSETASRDLIKGCRYPYHIAANVNDYVPADWCERAALGILHDLSDRGGIKHELRRVDYADRACLVADLSDIIRAAHAAES